MKRRAFSMLELIFVIVVMGILAKFGVELFKQSYEGYARSLYVNELQTKSTNAIQTLANRLTYRIKDSTVIGSNTVTWKGLDIDNWNANAWSGIIDLRASTATALVSPATSANKEIFFVGSNVGVGTSSIEYHDLSDDFTGKDVYEYYKMTDGDHSITKTGTELKLDGNLLTDDVSKFVVEKLGDGIHIHLCLEITGNPLVQGKTCKDKFVF